MKNIKIPLLLSLLLLAACSNPFARTSSSAMNWENYNYAVNACANGGCKPVSVDDSINSAGRGRGR